MSLQWSHRLIGRSPTLLFFIGKNNGCINNCIEKNKQDVDI